jgi:hypothetical protein
MALLYRGAGPGTYWHLRDARLDGFAPQNPGGAPSNDLIISHIARGSTRTPYVSFTRSFGVARAYAIPGSVGYSSATQPGYVYEVEVSDDKACVIIDPVVEIARNLNKPGPVRRITMMASRIFYWESLTPRTIYIGSKNVASCHLERMEQRVPLIYRESWRRSFGRLGMPRYWQSEMCPRHFCGADMRFGEV